MSYSWIAQVFRYPLPHHAEPICQHRRHHQQAAPSRHQHRPVWPDLPGPKPRLRTPTPLPPDELRGPQLRDTQPEREGKEGEHCSDLPRRRVRLLSESIHGDWGPVSPCAVDRWAIVLIRLLYNYYTQVLVTRKQKTYVDLNMLAIKPLCMCNTFLWSCACRTSYTLLIIAWSSRGKCLLYKCYVNHYECFVILLSTNNYAGSNTHNNNSPAGDGQAGDAGEGTGGTGMLLTHIQLYHVRHKLLCFSIILSTLAT